MWILSLYGDIKKSTFLFETKNCAIQSIEKTWPRASVVNDKETDEITVNVDGTEIGILYGKQVYTTDTKLR